MQQNQPLLDSEESLLGTSENKEITFEIVRDIAKSAENEIQEKLSFEEIIEIYSDKEYLLYKVANMQYFTPVKNPFQSEYVCSHFAFNAKELDKIDHTNDVDAAREIMLVNKFNTVMRYSQIKSDFYRERFKKIVCSEDTPCDETGFVLDKSVPFAVRLTPNEFDNILEVMTELFYS